MERKLSGGREI